jgi:RND family efflux transporter MFP subunit
VRTRYTAGRHVAAAACAALALTFVGCRGEAKGDAAADRASAPVVIGPENVIAVQEDTVVAGPIISGELKPEREAILRAQLGGALLEVGAREGQAVARDALLARIEARALEDSRRSAQSAVKSAENQVQVAEREAGRVDTLVTAGALAARERDMAQSTLTSAEAQLADARSRLVNVEKQLDDAVVRAPIAGVVSRRAVNVGDIVTPGAELFTVVDPSSMRLEASVPSESLPELRVGAKVLFDVRGYPRPFVGRLDRIAPQTDPTTRQLPIYVSIPNIAGQLVGGLYAEGRVVSSSATGLVVPINAVNMKGDQPWVLRIVSGKTERVNVTLGLRDPRTERVQVISGVAAGDTLLAGAAQGIAPGTAVQVSGRE